MKRQFIYVALFKSGLVKIGRSEQPQTRIRGLSSKIGQIDDAWCVECYWLTISKVEQALLNWAASIGARHRDAKEMFENIKVGVVLNKMKQISGYKKPRQLQTTFRKILRVAPKKKPDVVYWTNEYGTWCHKKQKASKYS